jgi:hypothetical protein
VLAERPRAVRVVHEQFRPFGQHTQVLVQRGDFAGVREEAIGQKKDSGLSTQFAGGARCGGGIPVLERDDAAAEQLRRIAQAEMSPFIDQRMSEFTSQSLGHNEVARVAAGDQCCAVDLEEVSQRLLQPGVEFVIARGSPRSRNVQAKRVQSFTQRVQHRGM